MADIESNIDININAGEAIASIKTLQAQLSKFYQDLSRTSAKSAADAAALQNNLIKSINATGQFAASLKTISTTTESFTTSLEKNKFSLGEYFKYGASQVTGFRKLFSTEFDTIDKVARERVKTLQTQYIKLGRDANGAMQSISVRPLKLDMNDLGTQVAMTAQKQQIFNQVLKQGSTDLLNFGKNTQWAGRQLMVGFSIPLGIFGAAASREFMKLEEQTIRFQRVYGDFNTSAEATDNMAASIKNLGLEFTKYGVALDKTMGLAADAAAMGKQGADLMAQVSEATRLSVLGGVDQQKALETTTSLTNAFGIASDKLAGKINFLNAVENQTVTSIEDLSTAIPIAAPVIEQLGGSVEDLTFFLTAMKEGGIDANEGANALKSGLASMINPTGEAATMLGELGINLQGIVEANKGDIKATVVDFAQALDTLDPLARAQAIEQLFGKFQFARMSTLFQNITNQASQANRVLQLTTQSQEELAVLSEREMKRVENSPMYQFQGAVERFQAALAPIGETFLKAVTPIINFGTDLLNKFNEMGDGAKQFWTILVAAVAGLGPILLMTFGLIANGAANMIKFFGMMGGLLTKLSGGSRLLGGSSEYMSQQQLEAAAVAASLNQVHESLIQTFTSEASAANNLAAAYRNAATAAQIFYSRPMASPTAPKKMAAGGIFKGAGTGTSDSIPAMVSNGEAIIPAANVKRFPGMVSALIAGKIPGFALGRNPVTKALSDLRSAPELIRRQTSGITWGTYDAEQAALLQFLQGQGLGQAQIANMLGKSASHIDDTDTMSTKIAGKNYNIKNWRAKNLVADSSAINQYMQRLSQSVGGKIVEAFSKKENIDAMAQKLGATPRQINSELKKLRGGKHPVTLLGAQVLREVAAFDEKGQFGGKSQYYAGAAGAVLDARNMQEYYDPAEMRKRGYDAKQDEKVAESNRKRISNIQAKLNDTKEAVAKEEAVVVKERAQTAAFKKSQAAAERKFEEERAKLVGKEKAAFTRNKQTYIANLTEQYEEDRKAKQRTQRANAKAKKQEADLDAQAQQAYVQQTKQNEQDAINRKEAARQNRVRMAGRVGTAGMIATTALGAMTMIPGGVGEFAQNAMPIAGAASMLLPMLMSMPPQIALIVAALGAAVVGVMAFSSAMNDARKKSLEMVDSLGAGSKAMDKLAEFAGTASASDIMDKRRENAMTPYAIQEGKSTFGANYLASDAGKSMLEGVKDAMKNGANLQSVQSLILNQMGSAIASGVLDPAQARSIVGELAKELGDYNFGIQINGKLLELIGPNGENILKDPIGVRVKLMQETRTGVVGAGKNFAGVNATQTGNINSGVLKGILGGAIGGIGGAMAGSALGGAAIGSIVPGLGTAIGAAVGAVAGMAIGGFQIADSLTKMESAAGAVTAQGVMAMQQQQEMLDSLQLDYEKRIGIAKAAGDTAEAERLQTEYINGRKDIINEGKKTVNTLVSSYESADMFGQGALGRNIDTAIENMYADNPLMQQLTNATKDQIIGANVTQGQEYQLKLYLASGNIDPTVMSNFLSSFGQDQATMNAMINVMTNLGTAEGNRALQISNMFQDKDGNPIPALQQQFMLNVDAATADGTAAEYLDFFTEIAKSGEVIELSAALQLYMGDETKRKDAMEDIQKLKEAASQGPITLTIIQELLGSDVAGIVEANQAYFNSLPPDQQLVYTTTVRTIYETIVSGDKTQIAAANSYLQSKGMPLIDMSKGVQANMPSIAAAAGNAGYTITQANLAQAPKPTGTTSGTGGGGGGGTQSSVLDDLLNKLRKVQMASLKVTEGWAASRKALDNLFPGGASNSPFQGIEQQMRRLGAKEDLITMIAGMDPKEFDKRKKELFTFDGAGNITGFRNSLLSIGAALRSIKFGEFQSEQQKNVNVLKDQNEAIRKLIANGFSMSEAYDMVKDAAFASAVAQEGNNDVIRQATEDYKKATEQAKIFAAAQEAVTANLDVATSRKVLGFIQSNAGNLSNAVIEEMLSNKEFATLLMSPSLSAEQRQALQQWISNIENDASLQLSLDLTNITGMEKVFNDGFSKAMEAFSAQEKKIELDFAFKKDPFQALVDGAQNMIADIQSRPGGLDDLQADLDRIAYKEEDINKVYKTRTDALQQIKRANDSIAQQKRAELTIADALTQGDIAAAAKAMEDARAQQAQQSMQTQEDLLNRQRQLELDSLTGQLGLTREQIETRIKLLRQEILAIEEKTLEPAQYQLALLDRQERKQKEALTVLGMTRREWEVVKNKIDVAKTSSDEYKKAMEAALSVVQSILDYWTEIEKPKTTVHTTIERVIYDYSGNANVDTSSDKSGGGGGAGRRDSGTPTTTPTKSGPTSSQQSELNSAYSKWQSIAKSALGGQIYIRYQLEAKAAEAKSAYKALADKYGAEANNKASYYAMGGMVRYLSAGGFPRGTDTVPAMLTPGEFIVSKSSVDRYGSAMLRDINSGAYQPNSMYNNTYSINVNVKSDANPDEIARTVITQIKQVDAQRIRSNRF